MEVSLFTAGSVFHCMNYDDAEQQPGLIIFLLVLGP